MPVTLTQEVEGLNVGDVYTGVDEAWLLASGYADQDNYEDDTAANLVGTVDAVNIVTGGNLVVAVGNTSFTVALLAADTPAAAATKIDTALAGVADAAIVAGNLEITSVATGSLAQVRVVSGEGTILANLGLTAGQIANGTEGGIGLANSGPADLDPADNPEFDADRTAIAIAGGTPAAATNDDVVLATATDEIFANHPATGPILEVISVNPDSGLAAGGEEVTVYGHGFGKATGVEFDNVAGTAFEVVDYNTIKVTTPAGAAGPADVEVLRPDGNVTLVGGFTYA